MTVKTWIIRLSDGRKIEVLGPNKVLARLNYAFEDRFRQDPPVPYDVHIESIYIKRNA